jgi:hypothetical protein
VIERTADRPWIVVLRAGAAALALFGFREAQATTPEVPPGAPGTVRVWYRHTEGCLDGTSFVGLLERLHRSVSLAGVGDHVDFVVTLAFSPQQSSGRLERQSKEGTVAIREVTASTCQEVAEVLALSLDLALQPAPEPAPSTPAEGVPRSAPDPGWQARLGAQATLTTGLAGAVLPGAALFFDLRPDDAGFSGRFSLRGALGERDAQVDLLVGLATTRLEGCWSLSFGSVDAGPCLGLDLGLVFAEGSGNTGRSDAGLWSSAGVSARAGWQLGRSIVLEAQAGVLVPFVRYRFSAVEGGDVSTSASVGFDAALGCSFLL